MSAPRYVLVEVVGVPDDLARPLHEIVKANLSASAARRAGQVTFRTADLQDAVAAATDPDAQVAQTYTYVRLFEAVEALQ
jgi:hypothetical protein